MFNQLSKQIKKILMYMVVIFIVISFAYLTVTLLIHLNAEKIQKKELINSEQRLVEVEKTIISNKINRIVSDVLYISDSLQLSNAQSDDYADVEKQWLAFSNRKMIYDQIRFVDLNGNEVIRVNYKKDGAVLVDKADLQNKKERYYFTDTISLKKNEIYMSKLDLNIENEKIEKQSNQ